MGGINIPTCLTIFKKDLGSIKKKYKIIYADPPWKYNDKASAGKRGAMYKYDVMDINDLMDMGNTVKNISSKDSVLFMWTTYPMIPDALDLMTVWGFMYKTVAFTWVKKTKNGKDHFGMGNWTRANPEICLLGVKGKPKAINHGVRNLVYSQVREHSRKPDIIRDSIVKLCGRKNRIELFARQSVKGWDSWGNQL